MWKILLCVTFAEKYFAHRARQVGEKNHWQLTLLSKHEKPLSFLLTIEGQGYSAVTQAPTWQELGPEFNSW